MSVQTDKLSPAPTYESAVTFYELTQQYKVTAPWINWFNLLVQKVNSIDSNLVSVSALATSGIASRAPDGSWSTYAATVVGVNLITLPNPGTVCYLRVNADNTVSAVTPVSVTGSRGGNAALANLLTVLDTAGLIDDNTTV